MPSNVPVFIHNSLTPLPDGNVTAYIGYDQWRGAAKLGEYTCQLLAQKYNTTPEQATGKVYILLGIEGFHVHRRTQGYIAGLALCPGVQVVGEQTAEWTREQGANVATAALQRTPDIDVFYGNSDEMGIGAALAAEKLGLGINQDFFVVSIDGNAPTLDLIHEGKYTATLGVDPTRMGQTVIDMMNEVINGEQRAAVHPDAVGRGGCDQRGRLHRRGNVDCARSRLAGTGQRAAVGHAGGDGAAALSRIKHRADLSRDGS